MGYPVTLWDPARYPGASSSGAGAATAACLCAISIGEDTGGSIRNPANNCGLVGLKTTWGLVSRYGIFKGTWSMDVAGPISRTVEDCAVTLQAIAGYDPKDPYTANLPLPDYRQALDGQITGIRVGVIKEAMDADIVDPAVKPVVTEAIATIGKLGASIEEVSIPLMSNGLVVTWGIHGVENACTHREWISTRLKDYNYNRRVELVTGSLLPARLYYKAQKLRELIRLHIMESLKWVDVLALPTVAHLPSVIPQEAPRLQSKEDALQGMFPHFSSAFNLAGVPALSVPCGFASVTGKELPVGLQLAGRPFSDGILMKIAHAYEQNTSWHTRRPPI